MSKSITTIVAGLLLGLLIALPLAAQEPAAAGTAPATAPADTAETLAQLRDELQRLETEVISKTVSMSTEEATAFWPIFQRFQAEQKAISDGQIAAVVQYQAHYATLTDADATTYVNALLERDQRIHELRVKYLSEYSKVLSPGNAARVIHISRRLGLASQAKLAEVIPLVR